MWTYCKPTACAMIAPLLVEQTPVALNQVHHCTWAFFQGLYRILWSRRRISFGRGSFSLVSLFVVHFFLKVHVSEGPTGLHRQYATYTSVLNGIQVISVLNVSICRIESAWWRFCFLIVHASNLTAETPVWHPGAQTFLNVSEKLHAVQQVRAVWTVTLHDTVA